MPLLGGSPCLTLGGSIIDDVDSSRRRLSSHAYDVRVLCVVTVTDWNALSGIHKVTPE